MTAAEELEPYRAQINAALGHAGGSYTFDDVVRGVEAKVFQVWPAPQSIVITEVYTYPQYKTLHFFLAGGNLTELERMTPVILEWGARQG
ncbi:MAG: hypothetical protein ACREPM_21775, partial [Gemmatimonadaceae bacterium]